MAAEIITIRPSIQAGFENCSRQLTGGAQSGSSYSKTFTQKFTAVTNCPVGPDWLFSYGVDPARITDPDATPFPALGSFWDPSSSGVFEIFDGETICVSQTVVRGPYKNNTVFHDADGVPFTGCHYDCEFQFQTYATAYIAAQPIDQDSADPIEWLPRMAISSTDRMKAVEKSLFLGAYEVNQNTVLPCIPPPAPTLQPVDNIYQKIPIGSTVVPMNALGELIDPAPEIESSIQIMNITKYRPGFDPTAFGGYRNRVNIAPVRINFPHLNFDTTFPAFTLRLVRLDGSAENRVFRAAGGLIVNRSYWEIQYEIQYNPDGWFSDHLNNGWTRENPDWSASASADNPELLPRIPITWLDHRGRTHEATEPMALGVQGNIMFEPNKRWYLRYMHYCLANLNDPILELTLPY